MSILNRLFQKKSQLQGDLRWIPQGRLRKDFDELRDLYLRQAPAWFLDQNLMKNFAEEQGAPKAWHAQAIEIEQKVRANPCDQFGRDLKVDGNGLGLIRAEKFTYGKGTWSWSFRPHNLSWEIGFSLDYTLLYSFYDQKLRFIKDCRLSELSIDEALELFKGSWCVSHELSERRPTWEKIFDRAVDRDFDRWRDEEAPKIYDSIKTKLPIEYQELSRIGTIYAHAETGMASLEIYTLDHRGYGSCQVRTKELEVDVFSLEGAKIFSGKYSEFEPQLEKGNLKLFFGLKAGYTMYP
jgi:hypothetical protein